MNHQGFLEPLLGHALPWLYVDTSLWTAIGFAGNLLFGSRFFVQWLYSERSKAVVVPPVFWHLSFWGSLIALLYAFHIDKAPVIVGSIALPMIYARNLFLLRSQRAQAILANNSSKPTPLRGAA